MTSLADELLADFESIEQVDEEKHIESQVEQIKKDSFEDIVTLHGSEELKNVLEQISFFIEHPTENEGPVEQHPEYELVVKSNTIAVEIQEEIFVLHKYIRDLYHKKFPELDSLVINPLEFIKTVQIIQNHLDIKPLGDSLRQFLPSSIVMTLTISMSTTKGTDLTQEELESVLKACEAALQLEKNMIFITEYVESRMNIIAPNLSALIGTKTSAQLMGASGGLSALSRIPSCNIPALGQAKKVLAGFSTSNLNQRNSFVYQNEFVQMTVTEYKKQLVRILCNKIVLAARVDSGHECRDGSIGKKLREEIEQKLEKWQEPAEQRDVKALIIPDLGPKKRRGGRRHRRMKEKYGVTELQKQQNRMAFGVQEEEVLNFDEMEGLGMVGGNGSGKLRAFVPPVNIIKPKVSKTYQKKLQSAATPSPLSGMASSVVFSADQGMELIDPDAQKKKLKEINDRWFSQTSSFTNTSASSSSNKK